jgi:hypothetical protein
VVLNTITVILYANLVLNIVKIVQNKAILIALCAINLEKILHFAMSVLMENMYIRAKITKNTSVWVIVNLAVLVVYMEIIVLAHAFLVISKIVLRFAKFVPPIVLIVWMK